MQVPHYRLHSFNTETLNLIWKKLILLVVVVLLTRLKSYQKKTRLKSKGGEILFTKPFENKWWFPIDFGNTESPSDWVGIWELILGLNIFTHQPKKHLNGINELRFRSHAPTLLSSCKQWEILQIHAHGQSKANCARKYGQIMLDQCVYKWNKIGSLSHGYTSITFMSWEKCVKSVIVQKYGETYLPWFFYLTTISIFLF